MPGSNAIAAALYPEPNCNYLYFCATGIDGGTAFATTYKAHQKNVDKYKDNWTKVDEPEETSETTEPTQSSGLVIVDN